MQEVDCELVRQGYKRGSCLVADGGRSIPACQATLSYRGGEIYRRIKSIHLSRPENYLSIYQSGCNFSCLKCHSWYFSKIAEGDWMSPGDILRACVEYEKTVTLREPRERATAWHAHDTCRCCGLCVTRGVRSSLCPARLSPRQILLSPQGWGPARNIVAFTGGDVTCRTAFYVRCTELIKEQTRLWVLIETNGYGLTPCNLQDLKSAGVDAFWLDIKAYDDSVHRYLTGCSNAEILRLPERMLSLGFVLEVLSLYIPGLVETDQLAAISKLLASVDAAVPFTILAFFPEHKMRDRRAPTLEEMLSAFAAAKEAGLRNVRLGNIGVFARTEEDIQRLLESGCMI